MKSKNHFLPLLGAYALAIFLAVLGAGITPDFWPLWAKFALADGIGTLVIFAFSLAFNNSSFYDPYWSVAPIVIVGAILYEVIPWMDPSLRTWMVSGLVLFWGIRLTWNFSRGWAELGHEDWRYVKLRRETGKAFWLVSFLGIHLFPSVLVFLGCLSLFESMHPVAAPTGFLDFLAFAVTFGAILCELIADEQLRKFRNSRPAQFAILESGLWAHSRHPNYFGEIGFWVGMALFALAARPESWWVWLGPGAMILLFVGISIPMIEKRMLEKRPHYREVQKRVSMVIPWLRKK